MKKLLVIMLTSLISVSAWADFNDGVVAYMMGDYESAYNTMISIAKTNETDPYPQYYLGVMYLKGQGVEQDYNQAATWLRKASENRLPQAQYKLAGLYTEGHGVPKDLEFAYVWLSVAATYKHALSMSAVPKAKAKLSDAELADAQKLVSEYVDKYGPKPEDKSKNPHVQMDSKDSDDSGSDN